MDNDMEGIMVQSAEQFLSQCSSNVCDIYGDPLVLPRVGDQYQAEIPTLMLECYFQQLMQKPTDKEDMTEFPNYFALGLPIPIMWTQVDVDNIEKRALEANDNHDGAVPAKWTAKVETSDERKITSNNQDAKVIPKTQHTPLENGEAIGLSTLHPLLRGDKMDVDLSTPEEKKIKLDQADNGYSPFPGSLGEPWRASEHNSLLLGLYIFGKNLHLVKRFVNSKEMADILSYYYGQFYRSDEHRRWSECRKMKSRRSIIGQKIFTGWRQQELLSRLFSHISGESQNMLKEISRAFGDGKISLEEYVFTLKDTVGIDGLVEAVAIGKGKQDLTGTSMDPVKTNNLLSVRPEIPTGKACSSLTSEDILKFLTGDFRLSKARSNDLFWEAVWPRLLARGWHSEQPKGHAFVSSKHSLVFLIPGVKKFSRRRLVKGNHYFDSVSDVLNKVASDPGLLEVENEAPKASGDKEEFLSELPVKQCPDSSSNWQRHCYLQPPISKCNRDLMKFTIVDTSLIRGGERSKVIELRTLPDSSRNSSIIPDLSGETEQDSSEGEAEEINDSNPAEDINESGTPADSPEFTKTQENSLPNGPDMIPPAGDSQEDWGTGVSTNKQLAEEMEFQFSQKVKRSDHLNWIAPIMQPHRLTTCSLEDSSPIVENISTETKLNEEASCGLNSPVTHENMGFQVGLPQNLSSGSSLALGSPDESDQVIVDGNCLVTEPSPKKPQPQPEAPTLIDLNLPHDSQDPGINESFITNKADNLHESGSNRSLTQSETSQQSSSGVASAEQQPALNVRRQSTRNRPLTARALEAIACGFLTTKRKRKCVESQSDSMSRSSRLVRGRTAANSSTSTGSADNDIA